MTETSAYVRDVVAAHYDLGRLVRVEPIERGYVNVSHFLETIRSGRTQRYVLRRYRDGAELNRVRFEHALLAELERKKFDLAPRLVPTRAGRTYVEIVEPGPASGRRATYLALFGYLEGEDSYTWDRPDLTEPELAEAAKTLAAYHRAISGWSPPEPDPGPTVDDALSSLAEAWSGFEADASRSAFEACFLEHEAGLLDLAAGVVEALAERPGDALPRLVVHGDYHPGNLRFRAGGVVGLLDFDWARVDARCFDVGLALTYFAPGGTRETIGCWTSTASPFSWPPISAGPWPIETGISPERSAKRSWPFCRR